MKHHPTSILITRYVLVLASMISLTTFADTPKQETPLTLTERILALDKKLFDAVNTHDIDTVKTMLTKDLEFYHDRSGLEGYEETIRSIQNLAKDAPNLRRKLVAQSTEVYEIKGFGALQKGKHKFCQENTSRPDCGTFQFMHLWKNDAGTWKIARVISYDH